MSLDNAQRFLARMREDKDFRTSVLTVADEETLKEFLASEGYQFDTKDLVGAMAACMADLEASGCC
jgi:predicted ribosomally synthesized peptide with nif11-like leader